ncbi:MAG: hypothetical protein ACNFW9_03830 [Candidatus Kerfeldbacteria bacterium]|jgi:hypothetical protein
MNFDGIPYIPGTEISIAVPIIILAAILLFFPLITKRMKRVKKELPEEETTAANAEEDTDVKKKKSNKMSWLKISADHYFVGFIPPLIIAIIAYAFIAGYIRFSSELGNWILGTFLVASVLLMLWRKTTTTQTYWVIFASIIFGLYQGGKASYSILMGTPEATLIKPVDISSGKPFEYKVNHPHWTCYYIQIPDNTWLEISAKGKHHFRGNSTLYKNDGVTSCGPEGATFKVAYLKNDELDRSKSHLPHPDNFPIPSGHYAALIGRVGEDGEIFEIGKYRKIYIEEGGLLYISSNLRFVGPDWRNIWEKVSSGTIYFSIKMCPKV